MTPSFENPSDSNTISENSSDSHLSEKRKLWLGKRSNNSSLIIPLGFYFCSFLSFVTLFFFFLSPLNQYNWVVWNCECWKNHHLTKIIKKLIMSTLERKKNDFDILVKDPILI